MVIILISFPHRSTQANITRHSGRALDCSIHLDSPSVILYLQYERCLCCQIPAKSVGLLPFGFIFNPILICGRISFIPGPMIGQPCSPSDIYIEAIISPNTFLSGNTLFLFHEIIFVKTLSPVRYVRESHLLINATKWSEPKRTRERPRTGEDFQI